MSVILTSMIASIPFSQKPLISKSPQSPFVSMAVMVLGESITKALGLISGSAHIADSFKAIAVKDASSQFIVASND